MPGPAFIEGENVSLRTVEEEDLSFLQQQVNDRTIWRAIGRDSPVNETQEADFYEDVVCDEDSVSLLVTADDERVGMASLTMEDGAVQTAELGYWIAPAHHEEGYGSAAARLLTEYGFEQRGRHRIQAYVFEFNDASQGLLESIGYTREGRLREAAFIDGEYQDVYWYGMLASEYFESR